MVSRRFLTALLLAFASVASLASTALAHFPWIYVSEDGEPRVFFGEGLTDREYHLPEAVLGAKLWQTDIDAPSKQLEVEELEEEGFIGLQSSTFCEPRGRFRMTVDYGLYHGAKLSYVAQHYPSSNPQAWPQGKDQDLVLQLVPSIVDGTLKVQAYWQSKPLADADVTLSHEDGREGVPAKTNAEGLAFFKLDKVAKGLNGLMVMHVAKNESGVVGDKEYKSAMYVATGTFDYDPEATPVASALPALPEAISSFGAATSDGWLYVYGGHIGTAHDHSRDNLSKHFRRVSLNGSGDWQELPMGPPLQGLALVAHGGKLYRIGGLDARNPAGAEENLHSTSSFACYDPATNAWTDLAPLPAPRSSHNAVVVGDTLYVVGGWQLAGDADSVWQAGALAIDLSKPNAEWQTLAEPPFKRRALAVSHVGGRVAVLCGMTDDADLSKQTFLYDPQAKSWSEGPEFPGVAFHGFGLAAWNSAGKLYAGGMEGVLYRLADDGTSWEKAADMTQARFFHQLLPDEAGNLIAIAGASPDAGHLTTSERIRIAN